MKTTSVIRFAALAAVLLASANVDAGDACYNHFGGQVRQPGSVDDASLRLGKADACQVVFCLINLVTMNDLSFTSIMKCLTSRGLNPSPYGMGNFANFKIKNGESVSDDGVIMNAELSWGKWQQGGRDVATVNNIGFDRSRAATFTAMGRESSLSGTEGSFEIHENGKKIAVVQFSVPFWGENKFHLQQLDKKYLCSPSGFTSSGSPSVDIICHKISSGGM